MQKHRTKHNFKVISVKYQYRGSPTYTKITNTVSPTTVFGSVVLPNTRQVFDLELATLLIDLPFESQGENLVHFI